MALTRGQPIEAADLAAIFALANTKMPGAYPTPYGQSGKWMTEMNRVRNDLGQLFVDIVNPFQSGPFGVNKNSTLIWDSASFDAIGYAFPDQGQTPTVASNAALNQGTGMNTLVSLAQRKAGNGFIQYESYVEIIIGGDQPGHLYTQNNSSLGWGWIQTGDPLHVDQIIIETNLPGVTRHVAPYFTGDYYTYITVDAQGVAPGTYFIHVTVPQGIGVVMEYYGDLESAATNIPGTPVLASLTFSLENTVKQSWPGIHGSLPVSIVKAPQSTGSGVMPFGIWVKEVHGGSPNNPGIVIGWMKRENWWTVSLGNLNGVWLANCCPLPTATFDLSDYLPPNSPVDQVPPVQQLAAPASAPMAISSASNTTPIRVRVTGSNAVATGNQVFISGVATNTAANGLWQVTFIGTGTSGGSFYTDFSLDGSVGNGDGTGGTAVKVTNGIIPVDPGILYEPARYPARRDMGVEPVFANGTFAGLGICICDVLVRRMPVDNGSKVWLPPADKPAVDVTLGVMRNGAFAAFQTVTIPAGADEVRIYPCWPVFTATALAWQSASAVLVTAIPFWTTLLTEARSAVPSTSMLQDALMYPISACGVLDVYKLLQSL